MGTLDTAAAVLRLLARTKTSLTLMEAVRALQLPKSTISRLLKMMTEQGLLTRDPVTLSYRAGLLLLELAHQARTTSPLIGMVQEALTSLTKETGYTGYISLLDGREVVVLWVCNGTHPLRVVTYPGHRVPASSTSTGRALLARRTDAEVRRLYARNWVHQGSPNEPNSVRELLQRLERVRQQGWAAACDEALPAVASVSCSICDPETRESLAFCLSFPAALGGQKEMERLGTLLQERALAIGCAVGDPLWRREAALSEKITP